MNATERTEWLRQRQRGVLSSDIACLCGVGFLDAGAVYDDKVAPEPVDRPPNERMAIGTALESYVAERFTAETGIRTFEPPPIVWSRHCDHHGASLDRLLADDPDGLLEEKVVFPPYDREEWGPPGTDQFPEKYVLQVQWQMGVAGYPHAYLAALFLGEGLRVYRAEADPGLFASLTTLADSFWERVRARRGMDGWHHPLVDQLIYSTQRVVPKEAVYLPDDWEDAYAAYQALGKVEQEAKKAAERKKTIKPRLEQAFGTAEIGILPDGRRIKRTVVHNGGYTVGPYDYAVFRPMKG